ncbi:hypothetical protein MBX65_001995 [Salmonella enterica subsp. enterica serovar Montevideo]|nr:hypothetical protein [Salmonella enterica subsp. enterica serovar Montevideo]
MNKFNSVLLALVFAISAITFSSSAMATESGNKGFRAFRFRGVKSGRQVYQSQNYQRVKYAGKRNNLLLTWVINYRVNK